ARGAVEEDEPIARQLLDAHAAPPCEGVVPRDHKHELVVEEWDELRLSVPDRAPDAEMHLPAEDHLEHLLGVTGGHAESHIGMGVAERLEKRGSTYVLTAGAAPMKSSPTFPERRSRSALRASLTWPRARWA